MEKIKRPDSIGSFLGLITRGERKLRMQMRTEKGSPITGISYKGDFELTGGGVKEKDLEKVLTPEGLLREGIREAEEELGINVSERIFSCGSIPIYWAPYEDPKIGKVDWAFMTLINRFFWDDTVKMARKTVDVNPDQLKVLGDLNLVVSGKKRMYRMGQAALYVMSSVAWRERAGGLLTEVKPDWLATEYSENAEEFLEKLRQAIS